jgi:N-hydroxyarylamine O-acetyltransferase
MDLDAYLARIGYAGAHTPTLDTLRALQLAHAQSIAFENLSPLMGTRVALDLPALEDKLVRAGRGGYCFEQNALFAAALREIGFEVTGLAARVIWGGPEDAIRLRSHMLLKVEVAGDSFVADVGFGGQTPTGPLRLVPGIEQATPHEPFRLMSLEGGVTGLELKLQSLVGGEWKSLYRFDLHPQHPADYELSNYYMATHPESPFRLGLRIARPFPGGRYGLANNQLTVHSLDGPSQRHTLTSVSEVRKTLESEFGLTLPPPAELDAVVARACGFTA